MSILQYMCILQRSNKLHDKEYNKCVNPCTSHRIQAIYLTRLSPFQWLVLRMFVHCVALAASLALEITHFHMEITCRVLTRNFWRNSFLFSRGRLISSRAFGQPSSLSSNLRCHTSSRSSSLFGIIIRQHHASSSSFNETYDLITHSLLPLTHSYIRRHHRPHSL